MTVMTGARYFALAMQELGVSHVFFVPTVITRAMAEMEDMGIQRVTTHGEKAAAYMADGYARALRRPGFCAAQNVGAANLAAGLRDAYLAGSPVVALTGGADPDSRYRHVYQEVDDFPMFDPVTKCNMEVDKVDRFPELFRQAMREATTGAPGPVHMRLPGRHGNILEQEADLEPFIEDRFRSAPAFRPEPDADSVLAALEALSTAERPVIVAGGGVVASGAAAELVSLAERLSAPIATALNAKAIVSDDHPLSVGVVGTYSRACANRTVAEADLVFFVGSHTGFQVTNRWKIPRPGTPVIQLDIDASEIGRVYPATIGLVGDARAALLRMLAAAPDDPPDHHVAWVNQAQAWVTEWREHTRPMRTSDEDPMRPERVCEELSTHLPDDAVVVADTGHSGIWTGTMLSLNHSGQRYLRCAGSLGWAFPASIGVKTALPDKPVLCFTGDGGFQYHLTELETAARYGINAVVLVNNNHAFGQEQRQFNAAYDGRQHGDAHLMWIFNEIDYAAVAENMGCLGIRVTRPEQLAGALERGFASDRPTVLDVVTDTWALADRAWS